MNKAELEKMRLFQLKRLASRLNIPGRSNMNKSQLVAAMVGKKLETRTTRARVKAKAKPKAQVKAKPEKRVPNKSPVPPRAEVPPAAMTQTRHDMPIMERAPSPPPSAVVHEPEDLPHRYYVNNIALMPRDPNWLYAYWELTPDRINSALSQLKISPDRARYVLRVHDVTGVGESERANLTDATLLQVIELPPMTNNWYVGVDNPEHVYCVECVLIGPDGRAVQLAKSNLAATPGNAISPESDEEWGAADTSGRRRGRGPARTKWLKEMERALAATSPGAWGWSGSVSRGQRS